MLWQNLAQRVLDWALALQAIPGPTFHEAPRAQWLRDQWAALGFTATTDPVGNVWLHIPGRGRGPALAVTAHLDTVFPLGTRLTARREGGRLYGPGIGDNSLGVAGLLGLVAALQQVGPWPPRGDLFVVGNVGEEGLGNLRGMYAVVERLGARVAGYIVLEGLALDRIYHRGLWIRRYRVTVRTPGGHSWADYGAPSAVHELAAVVAEAARWRLPHRPRTTFNVGRFEGGTTVNTIAAHAQAEVDWRSESHEALDRWAGRFEALARGRARPEVEVQVEVTGRRPGGHIPAEHPLVQAALAAYRAQGLAPQLGVGSTDANVPLSRGLPAVVVGLSRGGGAHTLGEYIETGPVAQGLAALTTLVQRLQAG